MSRYPYSVEQEDLTTRRIRDCALPAFLCVRELPPHRQLKPAFDR